MFHVNGRPWHEVGSQRKNFRQPELLYREFALFDSATSIAGGYRFEDIFV